MPWLVSVFVYVSRFVWVWVNKGFGSLLDVCRVHRWVFSRCTKWHFSLSLARLFWMHIVPKCEMPCVSSFSHTIHSRWDRSFQLILERIRNGRCVWVWAHIYMEEIERCIHFFLLFILKKNALTQTDEPTTISSETQTHLQIHTQRTRYHIIKLVCALFRRIFSAVVSLSILPIHEHEQWIHTQMQIHLNVFAKLKIKNMISSTTLWNLSLYPPTFCPSLNHTFPPFSVNRSYSLYLNKHEEIQFKTKKEHVPTVKCGCGTKEIALPNEIHYFTTIHQHQHIHTNTHSAYVDRNRSFITINANGRNQSIGCPKHLSKLSNACCV